MINLQKSDTFKIHLTFPINCTSSKDNDEEHVRHSKNNNIEFTIFDIANEVVDKLSRHQIGFKTLMTGSDFVSDSVQFLHSKCHKISFKRDGSYIDFPDWIKNEKAKINPIKDDDKFQYAATIVLVHEEIDIDIYNIYIYIYIYIYIDR